MRKGKLIHCVSHEPISVSKDARQTWADVWIRFTAKPGRTVRRYGPTLIAMPSLLSDLECERQAGDADDIAKLTAILEKLNTQRIVVGDDWEHGTPSIYTASEYIDRRIAEEMLSDMLWKLGITWAQFKWKRPRIIVQPV
jgi:hypothetical protein